MAVIAAAIAGGNFSLAGINTEYTSRGKGSGNMSGSNKHARSSFKQNKRHGL